MTTATTASFSPPPPHVSLSLRAAGLCHANESWGVTFVQGGDSFVKGGGARGGSLSQGVWSVALMGEGGGGQNIQWFIERQIKLQP